MVSLSKPLLKQGHREYAIQDHFQMIFSCHQGQRLHNLPVQPGALLSYPQRKKKKSHFLMFRGNLPCFSLCLLPLVLSVGSTEQSLALFSTQLLWRCLYEFWWDSPVLSLLQGKQPQLSLPFFICEVLQSLHHSLFSPHLFFKNSKFISTDMHNGDTTVRHMCRSDHPS